MIKVFLDGFSFFIVSKNVRYLFDLFYLNNHFKILIFLNFSFLWLNLLCYFKRFWRWNVVFCCIFWRWVVLWCVVLIWIVLWCVILRCIVLNGHFFLWVISGCSVVTNGLWAAIIANNLIIPLCAGSNLKRCVSFDFQLLLRRLVR